MAIQIARMFLVILMLIGSVAAQDTTMIIPPISDSLHIGVIPLNAFENAARADTGFFASGDSIFLHDGELYFRARAGGRDFFVSKMEIIAHSDSLVVYQTLRLAQTAQIAESSGITGARAERQRCTAITKNGSRCRRTALAGLDKCWQHKK